MFKPYISSARKKRRHLAEIISCRGFNFQTLLLGPGKGHRGDKKNLDRLEIIDKKYSFEDIAPSPATKFPGPGCRGQ
jgi:hypothetical protein